MTTEERLEKIAIKSFKQHWNKILRILEKGKNTYANKLHGCFEADTVVRQKTLANRVYGLAHANKMAMLSDMAIKRNLSCYLPKAIEYAMSEYEDEPGEQEALIKRLVRSEYVIFDSAQCHCYENYDEDADDLSVAEYPAEVLYDDWSERIGGLSSCCTSILMKSTGENFSNTEINWLKKSIQQNIDSNEPDLWWWFECQPLRRNKIWIKIYNYEIDKSLYMEGLLGEAAALSNNQLQEFVRQTFEYLSKEENIKKKFSIFNKYKSMKKKDLFNIVEIFLHGNWEAKILGDHDIRKIEDAMNRITGRRDRDYHSGINF